MSKLKPCPFCGRMPYIQLTDDEGNHRPQSYLDDPYSGIGYVLCHPQADETDECPIATEPGGDLGEWIYDTPEEAAEAWNRRKYAVKGDVEKNEI